MATHTGSEWVYLSISLMTLLNLSLAVEISEASEHLDFLAADTQRNKFSITYL